MVRRMVGVDSAGQTKPMSSLTAAGYASTPIISASGGIGPIYVRDHLRILEREILNFWRSQNIRTTVSAPVSSGGMFIEVKSILRWMAFIFMAISSWARSLVFGMLTARSPIMGRCYRNPKTSPVLPRTPTGNYTSCLSPKEMTGTCIQGNYDRKPASGGRACSGGGGGRATGACVREFSDSTRCLLFLIVLEIPGLLTFTTSSSQQPWPSPISPLQ